MPIYNETLSMENTECVCHGKISILEPHNLMYRITNLIT